MAKYQFKKKYADAIIVIPGLKKEITAKTVTDKDAEMILKKFPHLAHNIEEVKAEEADASEGGEADAPKKPAGRRGRGKKEAE